MVQLCGFKLGAGDAGKNHAVAPWKGELAFVRPFAVQQLRVLLQGSNDLDGAVPRLRQWVDDDFGLAGSVVQNLKALARGAEDGAGVPVLGFQNQCTTVRVQDDKVRVGLPGADGHVPPEQVVVIELAFQPVGQALFASGHAAQAGA